ncbi:MlaD family protein [Actinocorallia longicatena]|uniref:MCE family protein n=1 Tax=Actinocorallia longicatena TaxID=111803 RepID=A0ABP6Q7S8_9ACTN
MRTQDLTPRSRLRFGLIGAAGLTGCLVASLLAVRDTHPGSSHVLAVFGRAGEGLDTHSDVKIHGVRVGAVSAVTLTADGRALVTLRLDKGVRAPLTAEAAVMPLSVFGPKYVELRPGTGETTGPYLADGATIGKTHDPEELTDVGAPAIHLLDAVDPKDLGTIMSALGAGFSGRGEEIGGLVDDSAALLGLADRRRDTIEEIIGDGGAVAGTLAGNADEVGRIAGDLDVILPAITGDPRRFGELLDGLDRSARTLDSILRADPEAPGRIIDAAAPATAVAYRYRSYFPDLISSGALILTQLSGVARVPGPHGTLLARVTAHISQTKAICDVLVGACGPIPPAIPNKPKAGGKKK